MSGQEEGEVKNIERKWRIRTYEKKRRLRNTGQQMLANCKCWGKEENERIENEGVF